MRTNTFSANTKSLGRPLADVLEIVRAGYRLAKEAAGCQAVAAADMTAIYPRGDEETDLLRNIWQSRMPFCPRGRKCFCLRR